MPPPPSQRGTVVSAPDMEVVTISSVEELEAVKEKWDSFVERVGSDIYFTTGWLQAWWKYYGTKRSLRCYLVQDNGRIVAALPFFIENFGFGSLGVRVAKLVGADFTIPVFHPAVDPSCQADALDAVLNDLIRANRCDAVSLSPLSGLSTIAMSVEVLCSASDLYRTVFNDTRIPHTIFALPATFDAYFGGLSKKVQKNYNRHLKAVKRIGDLTQYAAKGHEAISRFEDFTVLHREQWREMGNLGHFGDWPDSLSFNRELVERAAREGQVRIYELLVNGEVVSQQFGFMLGDRFYWRLPARKVGEAWDKAGTGQVAVVMMIDLLIQEGVRCVEAGPAHYDHKVQLGGTEHPLRRLVVGRNQAISKMKTRIFCAWSDFLDLVYYRIWFQRLVSRLGLRRRKLWRTWIKTRL